MSQFDFSIKEKHTILVVDDFDLNRTILSEILADSFNIIEAKNGAEALLILKEKTTEISLILLDIVMPILDGFDVLSEMNKRHWIEDIPVIMISVENSMDVIDKAYAMGVVDFINRPFDARIVENRINNTIKLFQKQKRLSDMVVTKMYEKSKNNTMLVSILSHIVEFRNGESGLHVLHINTITELLLKALIKKTDKYNITVSDIPLICTASSLHDIGKISIPDNILNKPGRFTDEEFEIMKRHSMVGAEMIDNIPYNHNDPLFKYSYEICRWHHERWDGRGYPDGCKQEEIPISAQIVSIADVYDALTSERCYKKAYSHDIALKMIYNGECGIFNPLLIDCLESIESNLKIELEKNNIDDQYKKELLRISDEMDDNKDSNIFLHRANELYKSEHEQNDFFKSSTKEFYFNYIYYPSAISFSDVCAEHFGISSSIIQPWFDTKMTTLLPRKEIRKINNAIRNHQDENSMINLVIEVTEKDEIEKYQLQGKVVYSKEEHPVLTALYGKLERIQ